MNQQLIIKNDIKIIITKINGIINKSTINYQK